MECSKWEENGLLYSSGELTKSEAAEFRKHLEECQECRDEEKRYRDEHSSFYTVSMLGEAPSASVDEEIMRVCGTYKKQFTSVPLFPMIARRAFYSVAFFVIGFVAVGYIAVNIQDANNRNAIAVHGDDSLKSTVQAVAAFDASVPLDSSKRDSLLSSDSAKVFSRNRGNLQLNGVVPVDLKNK